MIYSLAGVPATLLAPSTPAQTGAKNCLAVFPSDAYTPAKHAAAAPYGLAAPGIALAAFTCSSAARCKPW